MAHFRSVIHGNRGPASRLGSPKSGIETTTQSFSGDINVRMYVNKDGQDMARVTISDHYYSGGVKVIYEGLCSGWNA